MTETPQVWSRGNTDSRHGELDKKEDTLNEIIEKGNPVNEITGEIEEIKKLPTKGIRKMCFTMFSTEDKPPVWNTATMIYLVAGREYTASNKLHWQSFVIWKNNHTFSASAKWFMNAHCEMAYGTDQQNVDYCKKGLQPKEEWLRQKTNGPNYGINALIFEYGKLPAQGIRHDLLEAKRKIIEENMSVDDLCLENPMVVHQYGRTLDRIETIKQRKIKRTEMTKCIWITGKTGTGKSHHAFEEAKKWKSYYVMKNDGGWFDGYKQEEVFIMNDFRSKDMNYNQLLQLIDKWEYDLKRRNKEPIPFISKLVIITSILTPEECFSGLMEHSKDGIDQLLRRITEIRNLDDLKKNEINKE